MSPSPPDLASGRASEATSSTLSGKVAPRGRVFALVQCGGFTGPTNSKPCAQHAHWVCGRLMAMLRCMAFARRLRVDAPGPFGPGFSSCECSFDLLNCLAETKKPSREATAFGKRKVRFDSMRRCVRMLDASALRHRTDNDEYDDVDRQRHEADVHVFQRVGQERH